MRPRNPDAAERAMRRQVQAVLNRLGDKAMMKLSFVSGLLFALAASTAQAAEAKKLTSAQLTFFETKIRPVLVEHCYRCHATGARTLQGGLRLDSREGLLTGGDSGPAIVPGKAEKSLLFQAIRYEKLEMPPKGKLPAAVVEAFRIWIDMGAPDPRDVTEKLAKRGIDLTRGREHWAFQPVVEPAPTRVRNEAWPIDPIDRFVLARLEAASLKPVADADRHTWLRRVSFDLTGLPPTPDEIDTFLRDDSRQAHARVVDRLLQSRAFGERWARHWLDLTGYADMIGTSNNVFAEHAWRYRDYLIDAFCKDKPFDRFLREQLAGDLLPALSPEERAENITATGFLMLGDVEIVEPDKPKMEADHIDSQVSKIGTAFLGMTLGCARCHDHKFDPIGLPDYYGIAGILRSSPSTHKIPFGVWSSLNTTDLPETPAQRVERQKVEAAHAEKLARMRAERAKRTEEMKTIAAALARLDKADATTKGAKPGAGAKKLVADRASLTRQRDDLAGKLGRLSAEIQHAEFFSSKTPKTYAMRDGDKTGDMPVYIRGNPYAPGPVVARGMIRAAAWGEPPAISPGQSGRLQLADWLADKRHPLTARVTVNRIWQKLFGTGIVRSVDYFGTRGEPPTHPELLDHLAARFMRNGWSQKQLIRSLVLSRTYRLSSSNDEQVMKSDPENRLYWRMNRQRLDAEAIRDGQLAVSGELTPSRGGPALVLEYVENTGDLVRKGINPPNYTHRKPRPSQEFERTIYLPIIRTGFAGPDRVRNFFDFINPAQIAGQRNQTVVATQSLFLLNNDEVRKRSQALAALLARETANLDVRLERLWLRAFGRPITAGEREEAMAFLKSLAPLLENRPGADTVAWTELCHALLSSNEFIHRL